MRKKNQRGGFNFVLSRIFVVFYKGPSASNAAGEPYRVNRKQIRMGNERGISTIYWNKRERGKKYQAARWIGLKAS